MLDQANSDSCLSTLYSCNNNSDALFLSCLLIYQIHDGDLITINFAHLYAQESFQMELLIEQWTPRWKHPASRTLDIHLFMNHACISLLVLRLILLHRDAGGIIKRVKTAQTATQGGWDLTPSEKTPPTLYNELLLFAAPSASGSPLLQMLFCMDSTSNPP